MRRSSGRSALRARHVLLNGDGALDGVDHAGEFDQHAVAHELDDAPAVRGDFGLDQLLAVGAKRGERSRLVAGHQQAVSNHVGCEYRREPALDSFGGYGALSSKISVVGSLSGPAANASGRAPSHRKYGPVPG